MNEHIHISLDVKDRILKEAAHAGTPRDAASVVLDMLLEQELDRVEGAVDLEEIKQLLVDALRVSRGVAPPHRGQMVG
jgi:hypothetical protein